MTNRILTIDLKDRTNDIIEIDEDEGLFVACLVPRKKLISFYGLDYSKNAGIYFLLDNKKIKYVGKSKQLNTRLKSHIEDYWNNVLIITCSKMNSLFDDRDDKVLYLEKYFINKIGQENLENSTKGNKTISQTNKATQSMLNKYIDFTHLMFEFLGIIYATSKKVDKVSKPVSNAKRDTTKLANTEFHYIVKKHQINNVILCENEHTWIVKAGAKLRPITTEPTKAKAFENLRKKYAKDIKENITTADLSFSSANSAGEFMHGQCINVWNYFFTADGLSMDDIARG